MPPPFHGPLEAAYRLVIDPAPEWVQDRGMVNSVLFGAGVAYAGVRLLQFVSKRFVDPIAPGFDTKVLPALERICIAGATLAPLAFGIADPQRAQDFVMNYPAYTSGLVGAYAGAVTGAVQDLHKRDVAAARASDR